MRKYFKYAVYLSVFIWNSVTFAGSYDDFFSALQRDNAEVVSNLLQRGFDPNTVDPKGQYPLILALRAPAPKVLNVLLDQATIRAEVRTAQDESPLMLASLLGLVDVCRKLMALDADVNKPGWTPLHYAATKGHVEVIQLLLDNHAYIDAASPNGSTPLMMAAMYGTTSAVKLLLESGADPLLKNALGMSAIDFAQKSDHLESVAVLAAFIRAKRPKGVW